MKNKPRYDRKSNKGVNKIINQKKSLILFAFIAIVAIVAGGFVAKKISNKSNPVQAAQVEENKTSENKVNEDENIVGNTEANNNLNDSNVTDGKFIEKYIDQQSKGQMPEGADGKKVVYLTFDDGPSTTVTPHILDTLEKENVQATFFVLGKNIDSSDEEKELLKREVKQGNAIGIHTYSHDYKYLYPNRFVNVDNFMSDVEKTQKSIKSVLGEEYKVSIIRLPGGHMSWKGTDELDKKFQEGNYSYIDWNALSKDAEGPKKNAEQLAQEAINSSGSKEKVVLLMHDTYGKEETAKSLPAIIKHFKDNGYEFKVIK